MSYFHVVEKHRSDTKLNCILKDLSETKLRKLFVKPFMKGQPIHIGGKILSFDNGREAQIYETILSLSEELEQLKNSHREMIDNSNRNGTLFTLSRGRGYQEEEIVDCGQEVTSTFLKDGPRRSSVFKWVKESVVVKIFVSIIGILAARYLWVVFFQ